MGQDDAEDEQEVMGDVSIYHRPDCHILKNSRSRCLTRFDSWEWAVAEGMNPCRVCKPTFFELVVEEVIGGIYTYHRCNCPCLKYIHPRYRDRYESKEKAEAKNKRSCKLCCPSLILTKESKPAPAIEIVTVEPKPTNGNEVEERTHEIAKDPKEPITDTDQIVNVNQLSDMRRRVVRLVDKLEHAHQYPTGDSIASRISRLKRDNVIPRHVEPSMRTVTEMRNIVEYESKTLSPIQSRCSSSGMGSD